MLSEDQIKYEAKSPDWWREEREREREKERERNQKEEDKEREGEKEELRYCEREDVREEKRERERDEEIERERERDVREYLEDLLKRIKMIPWRVEEREREDEKERETERERETLYNMIKEEKKDGKKKEKIRLLGNIKRQKPVNIDNFYRAWDLYNIK